MLGATQTMLNQVLSAYRERTGDTQLKKIQFHKNYMQTAQGIKVTPAYFEQLFNTAAQQIEQNRQQVLPYSGCGAVQRRERGVCTGKGLRTD